MRIVKIIAKLFAGRPLDSQCQGGGLREITAIKANQVQETLESEWNSVLYGENPKPQTLNT